MLETLLDLVESDLGKPAQRSGRWYFWPCPFHEDQVPSLSVTGDNERWFCFSCKRGGDAGTWRRQYRRDLSATIFSRPARKLSARPVEVSSILENETWQTRAAMWIDRWERNLWWRPGKQARRYLYARGLSGEILRKYHIGYNPYDLWEPLQTWGLKPCSTKEKAVYLPAGISIPWMAEDKIWKVNFRRFERQPKYIQLRGSQTNGLFGADSLSGKPIIFLVEGEFDALLLTQLAGDLVGVGTLGSASSRKLDERWISHFLCSQMIFVVGDNDRAGQDWSSALGSLSHRIHRANVPVGKDITEFWQKHWSIRAWVEEVILKTRVDRDSL
jgi:DNA primase